MSLSSLPESGEALLKLLLFWSVVSSTVLLVAFQRLFPLSLYAELIDEEEAFQNYHEHRQFLSSSATVQRRKTDDPETERRKRIRNNFSRLVRPSNTGGTSGAWGDKQGVDVAFAVLREGRVRTVHVSSRLLSTQRDRVRARTPKRRQLLIG